ncbi:hypothetical protein MRY87_12570 [bacterium]|nr:hypothetical protein [bacterium]
MTKKAAAKKKATSKRPQINVTEKRLQGLPFSSAKEERQAQRNLRMAVWKRFETARLINEFSDRQEYKFWKEEFSKGFICHYGDDNEEIVRAYKDGVGISIAVNESLMESLPANNNGVSSLVKSVSEAFANTCYRINGLLPSEEELSEEAIRNTTSLRSASTAKG